ncbi:MAG: pyridoxamine 5'-phosphate oxidase family protein [Oscillospiraceae bacterium]|nr:pyridoxamine 5'-phosphate oxidase family protein [Oscillospiraceae bacterium]
MFREMRRSEKALPESEMLDIMNRAEYGVLSTTSENGYPYGVPVNFLFLDGSIYFHSALEGHKLDNIALGNKASFCVVTDVSLMADTFNTKYRSVISFGKVSEVYGGKKQEIYVKIIEKFSKGYIEAGMKYIEKAGPKARLFRIEVEHMTAKGLK